jgi:hypothetical protein
MVSVIWQRGQEILFRDGDKTRDRDGDKTREIEGNKGIGITCTSSPPRQTAFSANCSMAETAGKEDSCEEVDGGDKTGLDPAPVIPGGEIASAAVAASRRCTAFCKDNEISRDITDGGVSEDTEMMLLLVLSPVLLVLRSLEAEPGPGPSPADEI